MNLMTALLILLTVAATVGHLGYLAQLVRNDGYGHRPDHALPRSHHQDAFERHAFL